jgi:MoxR-like ATPase
VDRCKLSKTATSHPQNFPDNFGNDYLDSDQEMAVIDRFTTRVDIPAVEAVTNAAEIVRFQWLTRQVPVAESVNRYAVDLVRATRPSDAAAPDVIKRYVNLGASVRATMFLNLAAKAQALLQGRYHVTKNDVRDMALPVLRHRVLCNYFAESDDMSVDDILNAMLDQIGH